MGGELSAGPAVTAVTAGRSRWCAWQVLPGLGSRPRRPGAGLGLAGLVVVLVGLDQGVQDPDQVVMSGPPSLGEAAHA